MPATTFSSFPHVSSIITRYVIPLSGTSDAHFTFSPVETNLFSQKTPLSGASLVNTHVQPQLHSSLASYTPTIGVSVGENTLSQSHVENGRFPIFFS